MTVKEVYDKMNGDYEGVLHRLMDDNRVRRFLLKFLDDTSFNDLKDSIERNNCEDAFRAAHTIKGVCQNLGITVLFESSDELTEYLRNGTIDGSEELFSKVSEDYDDTIKAISLLKD